LISEKFGIDLQNIAFVGDEEKDIQTAKNAGVMSFLINRGKRNKSYGEDIQIKSLIELLDFVDSVYE